MLVSYVAYDITGGQVMSIPDFTMTGKIALITGGRTGMGRAFALAFAQAGADVAICSRTDEGGELEAVATD